MSGWTEGSPTPRLLAALAAEPDGVSLPRLCKRLGLRMSVLLRELAWIGEDPIGEHAGLGWVRIEVRSDARGETRIAVLTERGRARLADGPPPAGKP